MDYAGILSALPASLVAAVTTTPQGLTSSSYVTVSDVRPVGRAAYAWIRPAGDTPVEIGGFGGGVEWEHRFDVRMVLAAGTDAQLETWWSQVRAAWHGLRPVTVTGCSDFRLEDVRRDRAPAEGPDAELAFTLVVVGTETP